MPVKNLYNRLYNHTKVKREKCIIDHIKLAPDSRILVLGSFEKTANEILKSSNVQKIYLVDIEKRVNESTQFVVKQADLNVEIPFEDNYFDFIVADQLIEHLSKPDVFLEEIYRTLKPGGKAIVSTENLAHVRNIISLLLGYSPMNVNLSDRVNIGNPLGIGYKKKVQDAYMCHQKVFTPRALEELLLFHGFEIIDRKYFNLINPLVFKKYCYFMTYLIQKI